jgi:putative RNA 2'-phosphotransferase
MDFYIACEVVVMNLTKVSKFISLILRHKPEEAGITLDKNGWADTRALVKGVAEKYPGFTINDLIQIVKTDEKQRYAFTENLARIRANQGHSIPVDLELQPVEPPEYLWHGSGRKYQDSIIKDGLIPKSRQYVHLSDDFQTAVKVGERHGNPVVFYVCSGEMYKDGYIFYKSANGVWLTDRVPTNYIAGMTFPDWDSSFEDYC